MKRLRGFADPKTATIAHNWRAGVLMASNRDDNDATLAAAGLLLMRAEKAFQDEE